MNRAPRLRQHSGRFGGGAHASRPHGLHERSPSRTWALSNGGLAYGLLGALFVGELVVRRWVKRTHAEESTT